MKQAVAVAKPAAGIRRAPVQPTSQSTVDIDSIPEARPGDERGSGRGGYYLQIMATVAGLPAGKSMRFEFATIENADHFSVMMRQRAKKEGLNLLVFSREGGLTRYFSIGDKAKPSWSKASLHA